MESYFAYYLSEFSIARFVEKINDKIEIYAHNVPVFKFIVNKNELIKSLRDLVQSCGLRQFRWNLKKKLVSMVEPSEALKMVHIEQMFQKREIAMDYKVIPLGFPIEN